VRLEGGGERVCGTRSAVTVRGPAGDAGERDWGAIMGGHMLPIRGVAGLCGRCGRRPQQWGDVLCAACGLAARTRLARRRRLGAAARWAGACLVEGLVGVGVGALALWPATMRAGPTLGLLAIAALLAVLLALAVFLAGCWLLRPLIRRWGLWAAADGAELLLGWLAATAAVLAAGYVPGTLAVVGLLTGSLAAFVQGRALAPQTARAPLWGAGSALVWLAAGGAGLVVELALAGAPLGVIAGAGLGRLLHGLLAGPILAWVLAADARP
jgi:ribosomal protein L37E